MERKKIFGIVGYCMLIVSLHALNVRAVEFFTKQNSQFSNGYISTKTLIAIVLIVTAIYYKLGYIEIDFSIIKHPPSIKKELQVASVMVAIIIVSIIAFSLLYKKDIMSIFYQIKNIFKKRKVD